MTTTVLPRAPVARTTAPPPPRRHPLTASRVAEVLAGPTADAGPPEAWPLAPAEQCCRLTRTDGVCLAPVTLSPEDALQAGGVVAATGDGDGRDRPAIRARGTAIGVGLTAGPTGATRVTAP